MPREVPSLSPALLHAFRWHCGLSVDESGLDSFIRQIWDNCAGNARQTETVLRTIYHRGEERRPCPHPFTA